MRFLLRPGTEKLHTVLQAYQGVEPSYAEVGATRSEELPVGYRHDSYSGKLGRGQAVWDRACQGLRRWVLHDGAGARVFPGDAPLLAGHTVLVLLSLGPVTTVAPCRIVYVTDEPDRFGFAYGTLPGHPERGEESFIVQRDESTRTWLDIRAFSVPAEPLARVAAPVSRAIQRRVSQRYVDSLVAYCSATPT